MDIKMYILECGTWKMFDYAKVWNFDNNLTLYRVLSSWAYGLDTFDDQKVRVN